MEDQTFDEQLIRYFKEHPSLSASGIAKEAGFPPNAIRMALSGWRPFPKKHINSCIEVLKRYGWNS